MTDIVLATIYFTDLSDVPSMDEVYKERMPDPRPAQVSLQVAGLIGGAKIEIAAIVVKHWVITFQP
jgi:2-iminobutanoate/2-iminopropanoate deaminase